MQWDEDIDLLVGKKSAPKQGRRSSIKTSEDKDIVKEFPKEMEDVRSRTRKTGLWSEEPLKPSRSNSGRNMIEMERFQNVKKTDINDDIPIIPDIDDVTEDLNIQEQKTTLLETQVSALKIDQSKFNGIDLSILTNKLYPEKDVQEPAEVWTVDSLFNDLST